MKTKTGVAVLASFWAALPVTLLLDQGYSLFSFEFLFVILAMALFGAALGLLSRWNWPWRVALVLSLYWFIDLYFVNDKVIGQLVLLGLVGILFFYNKISAQLLPMMPVFSVVFALMSLTNPTAPVLVPSGQGQEANPALKSALLYIILDEQASPLAVPDRAPKEWVWGDPLQTRIDQGFSLWSRASAVSSNTYRSVSAVMGLSEQTENFTENPKGAAYSYEVKDNELLPALADAGFDISVVQTNFLDLCLGDDRMRCRTYSRAGNMHVFADEPLLVRLKLAAMALTNAMKSGPNKVLLYAEMERNLIGKRANFGYFSRPVAVRGVMQNLPAEVATIKPGQVYFLHLLLPHFPYILDENCEVKDTAEWSYPVRNSDPTEVGSIYTGYWQQSACAHKLLGQIVDATSDKPFLTTIIHGDHGSRISARTDFESADDMLMTYLAVRSPSLPPQRHDEKVGLQHTVKGILNSFIQDAKAD